MKPLAILYEAAGVIAVTASTTRDQPLKTMTGGRLGTLLSHKLDDQVVDRVIGEFKRECRRCQSFNERSRHDYGVILS